MHPLLKILLLLFDAPGQITGGPGIGSGKEPMNAEDDLKFLREGEQNEDDQDDKPGKEKAESDTSGDEDVEGDNEEEEEQEEEEEEDKVDEEESEDEEEEEEPIGSLVTAKDLKAKYPDIFKKVPELKAVIYREQQYSQLFADPKEAQNAAGLAETFREMESDLVGGNFEPILTALKNTKEADFDKIASNLLPTLRKIDEPTLMKVLAVPFKQVLRSAFSVGSQKNNKNLMYAAQYIHDFIFDNTNLDEKVEFEGEGTKPGPEEEKYKKKLQELDLRDHSAFKTSVDSEWVAEIHTIFFDKFDPDNTLSKWIKDRMFEDAIREINKQLVADPRHVKNMEGLWRQAKASGYNSESKARIVNAALARARQIIPQVKQKLRQEALAKGEKVEGNGKKRVFRFDDKSERRQERKPERKNPRSTADMSDLDIIKGA